MSKLPFIASLILLGGILTPAGAHASPEIVFPAGNTACTVSVAWHAVPASEDAPPSTDSTGAPPPVVKKIEILRVNNLQYMEAQWTSGRTTRAWDSAESNLTFVQETGGKVMPFRGRNTLPAPARLDRDPSWFDWMAPANLKGVVTYQGAQCNHYYQEVTVDVGNGVIETHILQAWVDQETKVPIAYDDSTALYVFQFRPVPPDTVLTLPVDVQASLTDFRKVLSPFRRK